MKELSFEKMEEVNGGSYCQLIFHWMSGTIAALILLVFFSNFSYCQNLKFVGSIYDRVNKQPVEYANISVYNMPIGTITNTYGDFVLNLGDSLAKGRLDISSIGYKSCSLPIDSIIGKDTLVISLIPIDYQLDEIVVIPGENDVHTILKNVISKIDDNYTSKKYFMEAFFRHRVYNRRDNEKTVRLTEAAISIHQNHSSTDNKRIQINEIRNSNNYADQNTSVGQKLFYKALGGDQNPIFKTLIVEKVAQKKLLRRLTKNEHFSVSLNGISSFDDELVYIIDFKEESWEFLFKKYNTTHTYQKRRYYVNSKDFAILKAELIWISQNPANKPFVKDDSIMAHQIIQYRKFDNKYYPAYVYLFGGIPDMVSKNDENHVYQHEAELMVNEIATRRKDYERIKNGNLIRHNKVLWDMDYEYSPSFWENYNVLLDYPLNQQYKKDLEFEKSLEKQFKKK